MWEYCKKAMATPEPYSMCYACVHNLKTRCNYIEKEKLNKVEFLKQELKQDYIDYSSVHDEEEMKIIHEVFRYWLDNHKE